jgi:hypothetical protein
MKHHLPALLAPYLAAFLTASLAEGAPGWMALALFAGLCMVSLALLSAVVGVRNEQDVPRHSPGEIPPIR